MDGMSKHRTPRAPVSNFADFRRLTYAFAMPNPFSPFHAASESRSPKALHILTSVSRVGLPFSPSAL